MGKPLELPFDPIDRAARIWEARFGPSPSMAAVTSIMRAQQILLGQLDALLRPHELTFARYEALVLLTFSRRGALPLGVIGERLMVHPTSVTNIIGRLERQQLVIRRPEPGRRPGPAGRDHPGGPGRGEAGHPGPDGGGVQLGGYEPGELKEIFDLFRGCGWRNGDFIPEAPERLDRRQPPELTVDGCQLCPPS